MPVAWRLARQAGLTRRARREDRHPRHRRGLPQLQALQARARPALLPPRLRLRRRGPLPARRERPRHARGRHDRRDHQQQGGLGRHRLPGEDHADPGARRRGHREHLRHRARDPLRGPPRRAGDQPEPGVRHPGARHADPRRAERDSLRAPARRDDGGGGRQPGRRRGGLPRARAGRDRRGRHHRPRLRGRLLERRHRRGRVGPGRRRGRAERRQPLGPAALPPRRARPLRLPADLHLEREALRAAGRLRGHLDGRPARDRHRGAAHRHQAARPAPQPAGDPAAHRADSTRRRPARLRRALRLRHR